MSPKQAVKRTVPIVVICHIWLKERLAEAGISERIQDLRLKQNKCVENTLPRYSLAGTVRQIGLKKLQNRVMPSALLVDELSGHAAPGADRTVAIERPGVGT